MDHRTPVASLEDVGLYTLTQLAERTGIPRNTLVLWVKRAWLTVVKIDGQNRTTIHMAKLAAEMAQADGRGRPRSWEAVEEGARVG